MVFITNDFNIYREIRLHSVISIKNTFRTNFYIAPLLFITNKKAGYYKQWVKKTHVVVCKAVVRKKGREEKKVVKHC